MKSLSEYIKESMLNEAETSDIKFNLDGMENVDELIKNVQNFQSVSVVDKEITILGESNIDELKKVYDIIKKYSDKERSSQKRSSDEQYAQKTSQFEAKVKEFEEMINKLETPEPEEKLDDKKEDEE